MDDFTFGRAPGDGGTDHRTDNDSLDNVMRMVAEAAKMAAFMTSPTASSGEGGRCGKKNSQA